MFAHNISSSKTLFNSQNATSSLVDQVVEGHADEVIEMKKKVEEMWEASDSKRVRRTKASEGIPGYSLFGDNVGMYRNDSEKNL